MDEAAEVVSGGAAGFPFTSLHAINLDGGGSTTLVAQPGADADGSGGGSLSSLSARKLIKN